MSISEHKVYRDMRFPKDCWDKKCIHFHCWDMSVDDICCLCDILQRECDACDEDFSYVRCPLDEKDGTR